MSMLRPLTLLLILVAGAILGVPEKSTAADQAQPASMSGYVRLALEAGDEWSLSCSSDEMRSIILAYTYGDGSAEMGAAFSWRHRALFVRAKAGPVDQTVVADDAAQPFGPWEMSKGGRVLSPETLIAVWGVWGGTAECAFKLNGSQIRTATPDAGHLGADEMGSAFIVQFPAGEIAALAEYGRRVDGTLFALLIPDTGLGIVEGPEGQHYEDRNSIAVVGEHTSGEWSFAAPLATSLPGLHLWVLIVPDA